MTSKSLIELIGEYKHRKEQGAIITQAQSILDRVHWMTSEIRSIEQGLITAAAVHAQQMKMEQDRLAEYKKTQQIAKDDYDYCLTVGLGQKAHFTKSMEPAKPIVADPPAKLATAELSRKDRKKITKTVEVYEDEIPPTEKGAK